MIGVIADDLTGAAETGAVGRRFGLRAEILLGGDPGPNSDLVCIDTDSRSAEPPEAARRAAAAAAKLRDLGAAWIYKKVDSVLRGNVAAEIAAVLATLDRPAALLVPANPALGRTLIGGRYLVDGRPLDETEFAHDPGHPRRTSDALQLLDPVPGLAIHGGEVGEPLPRSGLVLGGAASVEDLRHWATRRPDSWLMAGASGFFEALLATSQPVAVADEPDVGEPPAGGELFVCGSASEATARFVEEQRAAGVPVHSLPEKLAEGHRLDPAEVDALAFRVARSLAKCGRAVLAVGLPRVADAGIAAGLPGQLARVAGAVLARCPVGSVFAEGGATAIALAADRGWKQLEVVAEPAPGVARLRVDGERPILLTLKPGSYRWPESVVRRNAER